jgi:uncharacterized delta-60 repeat protein
MSKYIIIIFIFNLTSNTVIGQLTESWHTEYNGIGDFSDFYTCIATDTDGSVYMGGGTTAPGQNTNYLIEKRNTAGDLVWRRAYNAPGNGPDLVKDIVVKNNKVYVTGYGNNITVGNDFWTMCFAANGDSLWANLYNDAAFNQYDQANAIFVDDLGQVYVTGESDRDITGNSNDDYLTLKLSATGTVLWSQRYNGLGNATDRAQAIAVDASGNVFITGRSSNGADDDYATIKYNSAGALQWNEVYDNGGTDRAADLGMDNAGNIYVTGRRDNGTNDDFYTIKYNTSGGIVFFKIFDFVDDDRPEAIAVNGDGSFAVTGRSDISATALINWNYYTLKYDNAGTQLWAKTYNGTANNDDYALSVAMDAAGKVAVTGAADANSSATIINNTIVSILYNADGTAAWTKTHTGAGANNVGADIAINTDGNVWVAGNNEDSANQRDAVALMITPAGTQTPLVFAGGGDNTDNIRDIVIDASGNTYVTGYSVGKDTDRNMCLIKLNTAGDTLWTRSYTGTMYGSDDDAFALALDNANNVVIAGYVKNSISGSDITILKYNATGTQQWGATFDGLVHESDRAYDMAVDATNNIYVTGKTDIDATIVANDECFTAKYNATGTMLWSATYAGGTLGNERGKFILAAPSGSVYVCGRKHNGTDEDVLLIKYNSAGQQQWVVTYNGGSGNDEPLDMVIDANENIYITGSKETLLNSLNTDIFVLKYNSAGVSQWANVYGASANGIDASEAIVVDSDGNVFVNGYVDNDASAAINNDIITIKYNSTGAQQWIHTFSDNGLDNIGDDITINPNGKVFVCGHSNVGTAQNINYDIIVYSINSDGNTGITNSFALSDSSDVPNKMMWSGSNLYVAGSTWNGLEQRNKLVVKYDYVDAVGEFVNASNTISVWPNPASNEINIKSLAPMQEATINVYDSCGKKVFSKYKNQLSFLNISIETLPAGIYTISVMSQGSVINSQFIKTTYN